MTKQKLVRQQMTVEARDMSDLVAELNGKTKELSTLAGYLAISICVNFVALGWVAWTKGWLS